MKTFGDLLTRTVFPVDVLANSVNREEAEKKFPRAFNSKVHVGIEIECEGAAQKIKTVDVDLLRLYKYGWQVKDDGSLRNHGMEWVTTLGVNAGDATMLLRVLESYFRECYPTITANSRTGVHIHLNFLDKTPSQLGSFLALYSLFEKSLFHFSGGRTKNIFCVPVRMSATNVPEVLRQLAKNESDVERVFDLCAGVPKYCAFGLGAINEFGTVEFRHASGTANPTEVIPWLQVLVALHEYATQQDFTKIVKRIKDLNTNSQYEALAGEIFPPVFFKRVSRDLLLADMRSGCSFIKESTIPVDDVIEAPPPPRPRAGDRLGFPALGRVHRNRQIDVLTGPMVDIFAKPPLVMDENGNTLAWRLSFDVNGNYYLRPQGHDDRLYFLEPNPGAVGGWEWRENEDALEDWRDRAAAAPVNRFPEEVAPLQLEPIPPPDRAPNDVPLRVRLQQRDRARRAPNNLFRGVRRGPR